MTYCHITTKNYMTYDIVAALIFSSIALYYGDTYIILQSQLKPVTYFILMTVAVSL